MSDASVRHLNLFATLLNAAAFIADGNSINLILIFVSGAIWAALSQHSSTSRLDESSGENSGKLSPQYREVGDDA